MRTAKPLRIRKRYRNAMRHANYYAQTNQTTYPAVWAGYRVGPGTGLARDCRTGAHGDRRRELAAVRVVAVLLGIPSREIAEPGFWDYETTESDICKWILRRVRESE